MKTNVLFTFRLIPAINAMLARAGIDGAALLRDAGLPVDGLHGEITAPLARIQAFVAEAALRLRMDLFGLELAAALPGGTYGVSEFVVRSAPTIEAGLRVLCELAALINPSGQFRFVDAGAEGELHYALGAERETVGMHLNELTIAYIVRQFESVIAAPLPLARAWFSHARTRGADEVAKRLGCPVRFRAHDCGFALARDVLATPLDTADPLLFQFLQAQARAQLARLAPIDIVTQVVRVLDMRLSSGDLGAASIARALAMAPRSLQRHLAAAGTSYKDVLAHVRTRRFAELSAGGVAEKEIAFQLGFSDPRTMRRSLGDPPS
jgi:AraC-like DNA-binding protein